MAASSENLISRKELARRFGDVSEMTIWRWEHNRDIGFPARVEIGRRVFFREADVQRFIDRKLRPGPSAA